MHDSSKSLSTSQRINARDKKERGTGSFTDLLDSLDTSSWIGTLHTRAASQDLFFFELLAEASNSNAPPDHTCMTESKGASLAINQSTEGLSLIGVICQAQAKDLNPSVGCKSTGQPFKSRICCTEDM